MYHVIIGMENSFSDIHYCYRILYFITVLYYIYIGSDAIKECAYQMFDANQVEQILIMCDFHDSTVLINFWVYLI